MMSKDSITTDLITDHLPSPDIEGLADFVTVTVPDVVATGVAGGRRLLRSRSPQPGRRPDYRWLKLAAAVVVVVALAALLRRWRLGNISATSITAEERASEDRADRAA